MKNIVCGQSPFDFASIFDYNERNEKIKIFFMRLGTMETGFQEYLKKMENANESVPKL